MAVNAKASAETERVRKLSPLTHRGELERVVESEATDEIRSIAAELLFRDEHVRTHARGPVRKAAAAVIQDPELLREMERLENDPDIKAIILARLGRAEEIWKCGVCEQLNPIGVPVCSCAFPQNGDLDAARRACAKNKNRGNIYLGLGPALIGFALLGGLTSMSGFFVFVFHLNGYHIDLALLIVGAVLVKRGLSLRRRPWTGGGVSNPAHVATIA
jgi:hypothetical protein